MTATRRTLPSKPSGATPCFRQNAAGSSAATASVASGGSPSRYSRCSAVGDGGGDGGFLGETETGQRPSERRRLARLRLEAEREPGGVDHAGTYQQVADESMGAHRAVLPFCDRLPDADDVVIDSCQDHETSGKRVCACVVGDGTSLEVFG